MKRTLTFIALAAGLAVVHTGLFLAPWGQALEMRVLDGWFQARGPVAPPPEVAVVLMDESSREALGLRPSQPWPRSAYAVLLQRLGQAGARLVVFDVLFLGPGAEPAADQQLADAVAGVPTVLGAEYFKLDKGSFVAEGVNMPLEALAHAARAVGLVNLPEHNGCIRYFWARRPETAQGLPTLSEAAAGRASSRSGRPRAEDLLNYYGPAGTIPTYSYYQAIEPGPSVSPAPAAGQPAIVESTASPAAEVVRGVFRGKTVLVRPGVGSEDTFHTPFHQHGRMDGVEIQATATANLMDGRWIRRQPLWVEAAGLALLAAGLGLALTQLKPHWGLAALAGWAAGWAGLAYGGFLARTFVPGAVLTAIVLPGTYAGSTLYYYLVTRRAQRRLERAFQFYLSPAMARTVGTDPSALRLGGESVQATALFTDIEGFTPIAEQMSPEQVGAMLNAYFTEAMKAIFEKDGTLIKFIGDAVFALWGAPIKTPRHAPLACEAALAIQNEIRRFNASGRFPALRTRIGLHTGPVIVGNFGSSQRFDFTAIGDTINLASRVEGLNKYLGTEILITDSVRAALDGRLDPLPFGATRVLGKQQVVGLHALFAEPIPPALARQWTGALAAFTGRRWDEAAAGFRALAQTAPRLQKAATLYQKEIATLRSAPLPADWQGELVWTAK